MEDRVRTWIDKSTWGDGPWQREPDRIEFRDAVTNLPCLMVRHHFMGNWCGYVGVPAGHPTHGKLPEEVDIHRAINYSAPCDGDTERGVCHVPDPGEVDDFWWLGFDCAHGWDFMPGFEARNPFPAFYDRQRTYRDVAYVKERCAELARQLSEMK